MIKINEQISGKKSVTLNAENFPRLFDGLERVRDISIIETADGLDVQTVLNADEIYKAVADFLRRTYQARTATARKN